MTALGIIMRSRNEVLDGFVAGSQRKKGGRKFILRQPAESGAAKTCAATVPSGSGGRNNTPAAVKNHLALILFL